MKNNVKVLILAAGKGRRMKSERSKVLHELGGKSMLMHVIDSCLLAGIKDINLVLGDKKEQVLKVIHKEGINIIEQKKQLGTADAINSAKGIFNNYKGNLLILYGDMPLIKKESIKTIINCTDNNFNLVGFHSNNPKGYGRIIKNSSNFLVVEEKNANKEQKKIKLCYSGIIYGPAKSIFNSLSKIKKDKKTNEYLFTDIFKFLSNPKTSINLITFSEEELMGINDREQLSKADEILQRRIKLRHMKNGVTIQSPNTVYICSNVKIDKDVIIEPNVYLGKNVVIKAGVIIKSNSHIEDTYINSYCQLGPACRIRKNTKLGTHVKIGNFVEIKNSSIGSFSKINHLAYIGDAEIGKHSNIGAGSITCNYDGINKNKTIIGNFVFIGSNCSLIAPINIGSKSFVAAGSTVSKNIGRNDFSIARARQQIIRNGRNKFLKVK